MTEQIRFTREGLNKAADEIVEAIGQAYHDLRATPCSGDIAAILLRHAEPGNGPKEGGDSPEPERATVLSSTSTGSATGATSVEASAGVASDEMCECGSPKSEHTPFVSKDKSKPLGLIPNGWFCPESPCSSRVRIFKPATTTPEPSAGEAAAEIDACYANWVTAEAQGVITTAIERKETIEAILRKHAERGQEGR